MLRGRVPDREAAAEARPGLARGALGAGRKLVLADSPTGTGHAEVGRGEAGCAGAGPDGEGAAAQAGLVDFAHFVTGTQAKMVRLAELLTGDRSRAEDLAQDGFAKAYAAWPRIQGGDPQAYVRRCIINANTDWWRRRTWREQPHGLLPDRPVPADMSVRHAVRDVVLRALARLTAKERAVIALRFYCDLTEYQIARELGIAQGTVKSTVARALGKLRADAELQAETTS